MATLTNSQGRYRIQFHDKDGKRRSVALGKIPKKSATYIQTRIQDLAVNSISGHSPSRETSAWVAELGLTMKKKLAAVGLIDPPDSSTLNGFLVSYLESRTDLKQATRDHIQRAGKSLVKFFGKEKPLRDVTEGDADRWRLSMLDQGLADNTVRRMCGRAKQIFRAAIRSRLIDRNPFIEIETAVHANAARFQFVSPEVIEQVIEAAPCAEWRLLIALARYGGLRTPSEPLKLRWQDILWDQGKIVVRSPKTEHIAGKSSRTIPIFPELRKYLDEAWEVSDKKSEFVITRYRDTSANLRTHFQRIIEKAGIEPWRKPWQNLRASRETELTQEHPLHVVTAWLGNSEPVAKKHYLHVLESDFEKALGKNAPSGAISVQSASVSVRSGSHDETGSKKKALKIQGETDQSDVLRSSRITRQGLEPQISEPESDVLPLHHRAVMAENCPVRGRFL